MNANVEVIVEKNESTLQKLPKSVNLVDVKPPLMGQGRLKHRSPCVFLERFNCSHLSHLCSNRRLMKLFGSQRFGERVKLHELYNLKLL